MKPVYIDISRVTIPLNIDYLKAKKRRLLYLRKRIGRLTSLLLVFQILLPPRNHSTQDVKNGLIWASRRSKFRDAILGYGIL